MSKYPIFIMLFFIFCVFGIPGAMALEENKYKVIEKEGDFEIRKYDDHIVAETIVEGSFEEVGNTAFRILFKYIDGSNATKDSIAMTAPVAQQKKNEKISMTAPVTMQDLSGSYRISFLMPSKYTLETLPQPLDKNVKIKIEEGRTMAAYKYSGGWGKDRYDKMKKKLLSIISSRNIKTIGEPIFARYNSPFMPWFLRRNEILIEIEYKK